MATVQGAMTPDEGRTATCIWTPVTENDTGAPAFMPHYPDKSVQVAGTFGGGTFIIEGSNDGTNYAALHDPQGTAISFTAAGIKMIAENSRFVRPRATAGTSSSVTVSITGVSNT